MSGAVPRVRLAVDHDVLEILTSRAARSPSKTAQWSLAANGRWTGITWGEVLQQVEDLSRGMQLLGLRRGQRMAILASGHAEWDRLHLGALAAAAVVVGIDTHAGPASVEAMLQHTAPSWLVVEDPSMLEKIDPGALVSVSHVVTLFGNDHGARPRDRTWLTINDVIAAGSGNRAAPWRTASPQDAAWVIFTSGTTGEPKALSYRHDQVWLAVQAIVEAFQDIGEETRLVSWLPLSNPFQRIINLCAVAVGAQTHYVSDPREVIRHLPEIRPEVFIGVPRFFEKLHAGIIAKIDGAGALPAAVGRWALRIGDRFASAQRTGQPVPISLKLQHRIADAVVLSRLRAALGGELRYLVSGSAPMPLWLLEKLHAMGLLVLEAYGLSECIVPVAMNRPGRFRFGTVGQPAHGNEVRLAADGELLLRSPGVFEGYLASMSSDAARVDEKGFLATGDYAQVDADGFIRLDGRKSDVFKTSTGRRVAPAAVEAALLAIPHVEHAAVFGSGRKSVLAIIVFEAKAAVSDEQLRASVADVTASLPQYMRPAGVIVSWQPLTIEAGALTANLKLRRYRVQQLYASALEALAQLVDATDEDRPSASDFGPGRLRLLVL